MIIEKFRRAHPPVSHPNHQTIPVLTVQMPSEPSVTRFYVAQPAGMGAPLRRRQRLSELEQVTLTLLRMVGVRILVIDELHNVLAGLGNVRRELLSPVSALSSSECRRLLRASRAIRRGRARSGAATGERTPLSTRSLR